MIMALVAVLVGLGLLIWSADRFVEGAAATAGHLGMPPLLIGMVVVGFGTSAPEIVVSIFSALQGNPGIALGNAYGSNIANIGLILGVTALISPMRVQSSVLKKELPILLGVTLLAGWQLSTGHLGRGAAGVLMGVFGGLMGWTIWQGLRKGEDTFGTEVGAEMAGHPMPMGRALMWLGVGLLVLIGSSRLLVWGAVSIAQALGVSDLVIGLTIVAVGTSLPELASSIIAIRKGEHDLALGNVVGSNLFNTLVVVGIAGLIQPMQVAAEVFTRDFVLMAGLTLSLFLIGYGFRGPGRINRYEGGLLLSCYVGYLAYLVLGVVVPG